RQLCLGRQLAEQGIKHAAQCCRIDITHHDDAQIISGKSARPIFAQVLARHFLDRGLRSLGRTPIRMATERECVPLVGGDAIGIACGVSKPRQQLPAHAFDSISIEARLAERQRQQGDRRIPVLGQRFQAAVEGVACIIEAHAHGDLFHALLEGLAVEITRAFVQHSRQKMGHAVFASGVLGAAALEGEAHADQRHGMLLDEPGRNAAGALHHLDVHGHSPACWKEEPGENEKARKERRLAAGAGAPYVPHGILLHSLPGPGLSAASLSGSEGTGISVPVTELRISRCLAATRAMSATVTLAMAAGKSLTCSMVWPSRAPSAYRLASALWLSDS